MLFLLPGGKDVLLYFVQESPGDYLPLDTILKTLGISAKMEEGAKPQVRVSDLFPLASCPFLEKPRDSKAT